MIRVIAGEFRGRWIRTPKGFDVRPILARIRKSLFDILAPRIVGSVFLDLYCGSGAVGIEGLSRGARQAVFVDLSPSVIGIVKKNLADLGVDSKSFCFTGDALKKETFSYLKGVVSPEKFDIIFMGPPYKDPVSKSPLALVKPTLEAVLSSDITPPGGIIIAQHHIKEIFEPPEKFQIYRREKYGDSVLSFLKLR